MKFPISRTSLQNYPEEFRKEEENKRIQAAIEYISGQILTSAAGNGMNGERKLQIWTKQIRASEDQYPLILNKLNERFPGTDIVIDPMKTYLLIDWS
jgi:hypothetical protein